MPPDRKVLTIFASSPGDVTSERTKLSEVVRELNLLWSRFLRFQIDLLQDATHTFPGVGAYVQDVINRQIGDDYDIYIGIMGDRFGSPTVVARSGTEEEFERALARRHAGKTAVDIMFFFRLPPSKFRVSHDPDQRRQIEEFRRRLDDQGVYYRWYRTIPDFTALIRLSLTLTLQDWLRRNSISDADTMHVEVDTPTSEREAHDVKRELFETIEAMNAVIRRLNEAVRGWNVDAVAATSFEDSLTRPIADLGTFSQAMRRLAPRFGAEYIRFIDSASRIASELVVSNANKKIALTMLLTILHLVDSKRKAAHQSLMRFHETVGNLRATSAAFAMALAGALEAIEELLNTFAEARDETGWAVGTIEAIRDLA